jgi:hypothetical protein
MKKNDPKNQFSLEFDEQGTIEVSNQIMDSYNSGFIDQEDMQVSDNPGVDDSGSIV